MADGFLGRWSRRKQAVREGRPLQDPLPTQSTQSTGPAPVQAAVQAPLQTPLQAPEAEPVAPAQPVAQPLPLTLEDVAALTKEADYSPFVARSVAPEVRNAAMKKLFSDPHYNVMDRLDIYIDDYSQPDPLPLSMLKKMASAQFLNIVETPAEPAPETQQGSANAAVPVQPLPAVEPLPRATPTSSEDPHDHPDL